MGNNKICNCCHKRNRKVKDFFVCDNCRVIFIYQGESEKAKKEIQTYFKEMEIAINEIGDELHKLKSDYVNNVQMSDFKKEIAYSLEKFNSIKSELSCYLDSSFATLSYCNTKCKVKGRQFNLLYDLLELSSYLEEIRKIKDNPEQKEMFIKKIKANDNNT